MWLFSISNPKAFREVWDLVHLPSASLVVTTDASRPVGDHVLVSLASSTNPPLQKAISKSRPRSREAASDSSSDSIDSTPRCAAALLNFTFSTC